MKKIIILTSTLLISCTGLKKLDTSNFSSKNNTIFYEKDTVATLSAIEYSIDHGRYVKEMTLKLVDMKHADKVQNLLFYVHKKHKKWEIELDYPIQNFKLND